METWLDSCTDSWGELLGVGGPRTEPQGKPDTEGGVNPSSDTWGVLLGCGGAGTHILRKLGIAGEMDSCTDPWREFLVAEVPGIDTRVESGTEGGADRRRDNRGDTEGGTDPCIDARGLLVSELAAGAAPSEVVERVAGVGIRSVWRRAPKPQRPTLVSVSVLRPGAWLSWEGALCLREHPASAADAFDRGLEN